MYCEDDIQCTSKLDAFVHLYRIKLDLTVQNKPARH
jgi:hypothetical protein